MTPDKARDLLDGTTPAEDWWYSVKGGWVRHLEPVGIDAAGELDVSEDDAALIVAAPALAAMIAGMRTEYAIAYLDRDGNIDMLDEGYETLAAAQRRRAQLLEKVRPHTRIMRRPVGEWEATDAVD